MSVERTRPRRREAQFATAGIASAIAAAGVGALAVGMLAIRQLLMGRAEQVRDSRRRIDAMTVRRLRTSEFARDDVPPPPIR